MQIILELQFKCLEHAVELLLATQLAAELDWYAFVCPCVCACARAYVCVLVCVFIVTVIHREKSLHKIHGYTSVDK